MGIAYTKGQQAENRKKWAEALRSGDYKQAKEVLKDGDEYCCLGVACEISGLGQWEHPNQFVTSYVISEFPNESSNIELPRSVQDWLGLCYPSGAPSEGPASSLIKLNDAGVSFSEIADAIEDVDNQYYVV